MAKKMRELITHSRQQSFKTCKRQHHYAYNLGIRKKDDTKALRIGKAIHAGIENLQHGLAVACDAARRYYRDMPEQFDQYAWDIERETVLRLICAYEWRWRDHKIENVEVEFAFQLPLINPETGRPTPNFDRAGKMDGIVRLEDGRLALKETKTVSEDIGPESDYWRRLRMDLQISGYMDAARTLGYEVDTVLYDCIRKPTISATAVPLTDDDGIKVVLDRDGQRVRNANGKTWRQTGDTEKGWVLQTRPMTVEEWGEKLSSDIASRPEYYFCRMEIPRLDQDISEFQHELWEIQQAIRDAQKSGHHYRTVSKNSCPFCPFYDFCSTNQQIDLANPPIGFEVLRDIHPELDRGTNVIRTATTAASIKDATTTAREAAIA